MISRLFYTKYTCFCGNDIVYCDIYILLQSVIYSLFIYTILFHDNRIDNAISIFLRWLFIETQPVQVCNAVKKKPLLGSALLNVPN